MDDDILASITTFLLSLDITDSTFTEYFHQILLEEDIPNEEKIDIISEFLIESVEGTDKIEEIKEFVKDCVDKVTVKEIEDIENTVEEKSAAENNTAKNPSIPNAHQFEITREQVRQKPPQLSRKEREERELLLSKYGYETEEIVERDGEAEFSFKSKESKGIEIDHVSNKDLVKQQEAERRRQQKLRHQEEVQRNKDNLEKQRLLKEMKKKGSVKQERKARG